MKSPASSVEETAQVPVSLAESSPVCGYLTSGSTYIPRLTVGLGHGQIYNMVFDNVWEGGVLNAAIQFPSVNQSIPELHSPELLEDHLDRLYSVARDELFEVGRRSQFSKGLQQLCAYDPVTVMQSVKVRLADDRISVEVLAETLRWAADQEAITIRDTVIAFLSMGLWHTSSLVRDTAALSLAYLDEKAALAPLQRALEREEVPELRDDLAALMRSLEG